MDAAAEEHVAALQRLEDTAAAFPPVPSLAADLVRQSYPHLAPPGIHDRSGLAERGCGRPPGARPALPGQGRSARPAGRPNSARQCPSRRPCRKLPRLRTRGWRALASTGLWCGRQVAAKTCAAVQE